MSTLKEKIAKLLALSQSPEPEEARAALLRARELMAKHKLSPEDVGAPDDCGVSRALVDVTCTTLTDPWAAQLSAVIAERYCCVAYRTRGIGRKISTIGFMGFPDDLDVCKEIYLYAYNCVKSRCAEIKREHRGEASGVIRELCNTYGWAFCRGLGDAYDGQSEHHQEWRLVMAVPQAVRDAAKQEFGESATYGEESEVNAWNQKYDDAGYQDGKCFDPAHRLKKWN